MPTSISFYARGDGSSANNDALNVENLSQQPVVLLTFEASPGGDIILEANGGGVDPDTTVLINGVRYNFKVELTGGLPLNSNKVPDPVEGKTITVISTVIAGKTERFFFVNDGSGSLSLMNAFGNGAINLTNANFTPPPVYVCYAPGTLIDTPNGPRLVETLYPGDLVMTLDRGPQEIRWTHSSDHPLEHAEADNKPVLIKAGALGKNLPVQDLIVSSQHRILVGGPGHLDQTFSREVFVPAKSLTSLPGIRHTKGKTKITWLNFACNRHEVIIANGCRSESLLLGPMVMNVLSPADRQALTDIFGPAPTNGLAWNGQPARECLTVGAAKRQLAKKSKQKGQLGQRKIEFAGRDFEKAVIL